MGLVIGVCVALAVIGLVVVPFFGSPFSTRRLSPSPPVTPPQNGIPSAERAFAASTSPNRRVVVRAHGSVVPARVSAPSAPSATVPTPPNTSETESQLQAMHQALAKEQAALEELDFERALGAVSDTDYAELQTHTQARIDALTQHITALMLSKDV